MATLDEKIDRLDTALRELAGDPRFHEFLGAVRAMRDEAVRHACLNSTVKSQGKVLAALGEIRAYEDILARASEYQPDEYQ